MVIEVRDLVVRYRWRDKPVLRGVNAVFDSKSLILGPNGSGKTTLFRAVCGLASIDSGDVLIDGRSVKDIYGSPGLLSTNFPEIYKLVYADAHEIIRLYIDIAGGDLDLAFRLTEDLGLGREFLRRRRLHELSSGQLKIVTTSLALAMRARHVLLDEPFEQLDPARKALLIKHMRDHGGIILINTHETWLLRHLQEWSAYFIFEGSLYGSARVGDLLSSKIVFTDSPGAILKIKISDRTVSIMGGGEGTPLASIESLDRIYDLALEAR